MKLFIKYDTSDFLFHHFFCVYKFWSNWQFYLICELLLIILFKIPQDIFSVCKCMILCSIHVSYNLVLFYLNLSFSFQASIWVISITCPWIYPIFCLSSFLLNLCSEFRVHIFYISELDKASDWYSRAICDWVGSGYWFMFQ